MARPIPAADRRTPRLHPVRSGLDTAAVMAVDMGMAMARPTVMTTRQATSCVKVWEAAASAAPAP